MAGPMVQQNGANVPVPPPRPAHKPVLAIANAHPAPSAFDPISELSLSLSANYDASALLNLPVAEQQSLSDEFLAHQRLFGFQSSSVRNQYEHLCFLINNARDRYGNNALAYLHARMFSNYRRWVAHINAQRWCFQKHIKHHFTDARYGDRNRVQDLVLWLLIWGEAANCRHMPEFLCFLFFRMSQQRAKVIESGSLPIDHSRDEWYRSHVIEPAYQIVTAMMQYQRNNGSLKDHINRPHYDDINEYFWNRAWLDHGKNYHKEDVEHFWGAKFMRRAIDTDAKGAILIPQKEGSDTERDRKDARRRVLKTFIERRSWLNLWRSFDRIVQLHLFALHILIVFAYGWYDNYDILCSSVLTLAGLDALSELLEVYFYWGVIYNLGMTINLLTRIAIKAAIFLIGLYLFYITWDFWKYVAVAYFGVRVIFELINLQTHRWLRKWNKGEDRNFESRVSSQLGCRYFIQLVFWILLFAAKCVVSYFSYIKPLIEVTQTLLNVTGFVGADGIAKEASSSYSNILLIVFLWIPTITIYLIDTQIFYSIAIVVVGLVLGVRDKISNVRSWEDIQKRWSYTWRRGARKFFGSSSMNSVQVSAISGLGQRNPLRLPSLNQPPWHLIHVVWKNIVEELRATDMISYHDEQLLHFGHFQLITKPASPAQSINAVPLPPRPMRLQDFYFLPAFVTSGHIQSLLSLTGACEESYHNKENAKKLVVRQMHKALYNNEAMRTSLDELYTATSLLLRIFVKDCMFDPASEGNKLIDYAIRQSTPHTFMTSSVKQVTNAVNESIAIAFDMGYQNIVRKRPTTESDSTMEHGWMDRADQVNTKNFSTMMMALYRTWLCIEQDLTMEQANAMPAPVILVQQLDEIENNGASTLLRVLHHLTTTAAVDARPHNQVVTDRLMFFLSSLNMNMPNRQNSISEMYSWTVLTPYVDELVIYTEEDIQTPNDDGVTQEFYLQCLYRKEWLNFQERMEVDPRGHDPQYRAQQKREWCSYRGQTLLRTVRGMMFYEKALKVLAMLEMAPNSNGFGTPEQMAAAQNIARRKYQYVLSCQRFGQFVTARDRRERGELVDRKMLPDLVRKERKKQFDEAQKCDDIEYILRKWPHLRVAYVDDRMENGQKVFYSVLVKAEEIRPDADNQHALINDYNGSEYGIGGEIVEVYRVRLPGTILVGEGKPENQNHAIIFTRGEFTEAIDMNQDNYFEEALKMRNLLEEFDPMRLNDKRSDEVTRLNPVKSNRSQSGILKFSILGFREHIFTANLMSVGTYMSLMEATFVSITLRAFAFFGSRMHYGHPDLLDKLFFMTRGGVSKASKMLHVSEDIFAGFKSTLRGGRIDHREYTQCGKGRDLGFGQLFLFEAKLASGAGEQALSRECYRLGRYLDLPRLLSFFYGAVGFYTTTTLMVFSIVTMLFARMLLALTNVDAEVDAYNRENGLSMGLLQGTSVFQLGLLLTFSMLAEIALETSLLRSMSTLAWMLITGSPLFFFFHMLTKAFFFNNSILYGGAKYRATGRGFVLSRESFVSIYRNYARTHVYSAMKLLFMLVVFGIFYNVGSYIEATWSVILLLIAWLYAPVWYDPMAFDHDKVMRDFAQWKRWLTRVSPNEDDSWQAWWVNEHDFIKRIPPGTRRLNVLLNLLIPAVIIICCVANVGTNDIDNIWYLIVCFGGTVGVVLLFTFILYVCKPIGDTWRYFKFILFFLLIAFAVLSLVVTPSATTTRFKNFCVFLITTLLTFNAMCKILVYYGAGPYHFSFVVHWFRWTDAFFGFIIYFPWLLISFFDVLGNVQTRLLYNMAFSKGIQANTLLHGSGLSVSKAQKKYGKRLDSMGNVVYGGRSSRFGAREGDDWEGAVTPAEWERQELIGRRSRLGLSSAERADSGNPSPMPHSSSMNNLKQRYQQGGNGIASATDISLDSSRRPSQLYHADSGSQIMSPQSSYHDKGHVVPNLVSPTGKSVVGVVYGTDGRVLQRYDSEGDNRMRRHMAAARALEAEEDNQDNGPRVSDAYNYSFTLNPEMGLEEKTDPVALVYNPVSPGTALHMQNRRREAELAAQEDMEPDGVSVSIPHHLQHYQHVDLDELEPRSSSVMSRSRNGNSQQPGGLVIHIQDDDDDEKSLR